MHIHKRLKKENVLEISSQARCSEIFPGTGCSEILPGEPINDINECQDKIKQIEHHVVNSLFGSISSPQEGQGPVISV